MIETTETLVERAQSAHGEKDTQQDAFRQLFERFQRAALQQARALLRDDDLAEDAVQEAFLAAYQNLGQLRDPRAFPGWLRRIVHTRCQRLLRKKRPATRALEQAGQLPGELPSPEAALVAREQRARLREALRALPEHERQALDLFYLKGKSQKEIADTLDLPLTTVKKRLQYARQRLRGLVNSLTVFQTPALRGLLAELARTTRMLRRLKATTTATLTTPLRVRA